MNVIKIDEWINAITHYIGVVLALIGNGALLVHSYRTENNGYFIGSIIFTISLVFLYTMSGTYHIVYNAEIKKILKILDHSAIYVLIASSYTPYLLGVFDTDTKWILFSIQWGMTIIGIVFKIFYSGKFRILSTLIYLFMGWMIMFVYDDLVELIPSFSLKLLIFSGVSYSIGTVFYLMKKFKFSHGIWHLFVLAGSIFNYFSVYYLII